MARVYVVTPMQSQDLSPLRNFGKLRFVNHKFAYADELNRDLSLPEALWSPLDLAAQEFDPERDYVAIAGDHLQVVQLVALIAQRGEPFKVLRWDRQAGGYFPVLVDLADEELDSSHDLLDEVRDA